VNRQSWQIPLKHWPVIIAALMFGAQLLAPPQLGAQQSFRTGQSLRPTPKISIQKGNPQSKPSSQLSAPAGRFLGWRRANAEGAQTINRFRQMARGRPPSHHVRPGFVANNSKFGNPLEVGSFGKPLSPGSSTSFPGILLRPSIPAGALPSDVVTGDFNGDSKLDWVVANAGDNSLDLYLGNGDGTSQLPFVIQLLGQSPVGIAAADLNGDHKLDLVIAEADSGTVGILFGNGDGTFQPEVEITNAFAQPLGIAIADVNKDGFPDLLVAIAGDGTVVNSNFMVLLNDGTGHFGLPIFAPNPQSDAIVAGTYLSVADANGDGVPDVLVTGLNPDGTTLQTFFGNGDGSFSGGALLWTGNMTLTFDIEIGQGVFGDLSGDGCPDVALGLTNAQVVLLFNDCRGNFPLVPSEEYGVGDATYGLAVADINGDGHPDIIAGGFPIGLEAGSPIGKSTGNTLTVLFNNGSGTFGSPHIYRGDPGIFSLTPADLKGDGLPSVISANQNTNSVTVYSNDGLGGFGEPMGGYDGFVAGTPTSPANAPDSAFEVADIDGDGKPDFAVLEFPELGSFNNMVTLAVMLNQGNGQFSNPIRTPMISGNPSLRIADYTLADFRNTGRPDFLAEVFDDSATSSPQLIYASNLGNGQFGAPVQIPFTTQGTYGFGAIGVGDFNKDGKLDFAVTTSTGSNSTQQLTVYLGNGDGTFTMSFQTDFGPAGSSLFPLALFVGDANGDGKQDIFVWLYTEIYPPSGNDLFEFLGNGNGTFQSPQDVIQNLIAMTMTDLNHDGILDVIGLSGSQLGEINLGILTATTQIYIGQGDGGFSAPVSYSPYAGVLDYEHGDNVAFDSGTSIAPYLGDFNGDGNLDLAIFEQDSLDNGPAYVQFLQGNGDGTFIPTFDIFQIGIPGIPDLTALNLLGDGRSSFVQTPNFTSSFQVIPAAAASPFQVEAVETPVIGGADALLVSSNVSSSSSTVLTLSPSDSNVQIPATATIPAGQVSVLVPFTLTNSIAKNRWFSITAQSGASQQVAYDFPGRAGFDAFDFVVVPPPVNIVQQGFPSELWSAGVQSNGDASGTFQVSCAGLPAGASCQFQAISGFTIVGGGFENVLFAVNTTLGTPTGNFTFSLIATDGVTTLTSSQQVQVTPAPPALSANPTFLFFLPTIDGTTDTEQAVEISNTTGSTITSLVITGPANSQPEIGTFLETNNCGSSLAPFSLCTVQVTFTAVSPGVLSDQISINGSAGSISIPLSATATDFSIQIAQGGSSSQTIHAGQSATFNLQLNPDLVQGTVSFNCTGVPQKSQCEIPTPIIVSGMAAIPLQVSLSTTAAGALSPDVRRHPGTPVLPPASIEFLFLVLGTSPVILIGLRASRFPIRRAIMVALFLSVSLALSNCGGGGPTGGGGGGSGGGGGGGSSGTPAGTYMLTVTASFPNGSGSVQMSVTVLNP
jgi:FG-GAP-like repeat